MDEAIERALRACLVQVRGGPDATTHGTGFFVGPGLVLTCHHVVQGASGALILRDGQTADARVQPLRLSQFADVALLQTDMSCELPARLGVRAAVHDLVAAIGFPVDGSAHEEQITGRIEDLDFQYPSEPWKSGARLIKFKDGQVKEGMSGSPLVNERTCQVIGVVRASRGVDSNLGGLAVRAAILLEPGSQIALAQPTNWGLTVWRDTEGPEGPFVDYYISEHMPFFGREPALAALDEWLTDGSQRALLVTNAGRGKSSLLARWYEQLRQSFAEAGDRDRVALVPISIRFGHARKDRILRSLAEAVGELRGQDAAAARTDGACAYIRDGLSRPAAAGRRLVLIVDGLDETVGWRFDESIVPRALGQGVHVLLAARRLGNADTHEWRQRVGWAEPVSVRELGLEPLTGSDLAQASRQWWGLNAAAAADYGQWLLEVTGGDPLIVGLRLRTAGRQAPDRKAPAAMEPGLDGLFSAWWTQQEQQWGNDAATALGSNGRRIFNVLAAAYEPLSRAGLRSIHECLGSPIDGDQLDAALRLLGRFIIGSNGAYMIGHPEVARWRWRWLAEDHEERKLDEAIVAWARASLCRWGEAQEPVIDPYIFRCLARHLERLGASSGADIELLVGRAWREHQMGLDGWPNDYVRDLDVVQTLCDTMDRSSRDADYPALGYRAEIQLRKHSAWQVRDRVNARMARSLLKHQLWTSARALIHVLDVYPGDFPRLAAIGMIADALAPPELETAMAALTVQQGYEFGSDASLGAWKLAAAAGRCAELSHDRAALWAANLPGLGAPSALLGLAEQSSGQRRKVLLDRGFRALAPCEAGARVLMALGVQIGAAFPFKEVAAAVQPAPGCMNVADRLGFAITDRQCGAAALRIAWRWLGRAERVAAMEHLVATAKDLLSASDRVNDWGLAIGAVWDVCTVADARRLFRLLRAGVAADRHHHFRERPLFEAMLRFGSRLRLTERRMTDLANETHRAAFAGGEFAPHTRGMFAAAAALPEWRAPLSELVHGLRYTEEHQAIEVLAVIADELPANLLDDHWDAIGHFSTDWRERAMCAVLAAQAGLGKDAARQALDRAHSPDHGVEHDLLRAVLEAMQGQRDANHLLAARRALLSVAAENRLRAHLLSVLAPPLAPWPMEEVELWVPEDTDHRSWSLSVLLPQMDLVELIHTRAPARLRIELPYADAAPVEATLRRIASANSMDTALRWAQAMADAAEDKQGHWRTAAVCALGPSADSDSHQQFRVLVESIPDFHLRAVAAAALIAGCSHGADRTRLWHNIEQELAESARRQDGRRIAAVLRRLSGVELRDAIELVRLDNRLLARAAFPSGIMWVDCARHLMHWASARVIDTEFIRDGHVIRLPSGSDNDDLYAALAPRLMELGRVTFAIKLAAMATGLPRGDMYARMARLVANDQQAKSLLCAIRKSPYDQIAVFAVARTLTDAGSSLPKSSVHALCLAILSSARSDAELRLYLTAVAALMPSLTSSQAIERLAQAFLPAETVADCREA